MPGARTRLRQRGTTMIEIIVVMIVSGILAGGMAVFLVAPLEGYRDVNRRARLVDAGESALRRMARDVRRALPNSLRVAGGGEALEFLYALDGARYRRQGGVNPGPVDHQSPDDRLSFAVGGDSRFNVLGRFETLPISYGNPLSAGTRIAIFPTSTAIYSDAALGADPGLITPAGNAITIADDGDEDQIRLAAAHQFRFESPGKRLFVVEGPVTYLCDLAQGTLTRFSRYAISQAQPLVAGAAPLAAAESGRIANHVTACRFVYQPGTPQRAALMTLELTLAEAGERVRLLHQVHVENTP